MIVLALLGVAVAEIPPPDYRDALMASAADGVAQLARERGLEAATDFVKRWERSVGPDARLVYELGLACRLAGDAKGARTWLDRALELNPDLAAARYDRGEVLLNAGEIDAAEKDFREVVRLAPDQWAGHFRLADVAARRGDPQEFEADLLLALRHGFSFRAVVGDPRWKGYLADAELGPVVRRLVVVYQDERVLEELERPVE